MLGSTAESDLATAFGDRLGPHLRRLAGFEDDRAVETVRVAKSESRETTFDVDLRGLDALEPVIDRLSTELCETLVRQERAGRTIGIKVRLDDFSTHTRAHTRKTKLAVARASAMAREMADTVLPRYKVDASGDLVSVTDQADNVTHLVYLSGVTDHHVKDAEMIDHIVRLVEAKAAEIEATAGQPTLDAAE